MFSALAGQENIVNTDHIISTLYREPLKNGLDNMKKCEWNDQVIASVILKRNTFNGWFASGSVGNLDRGCLSSLILNNFIYDLYKNIGSGDAKCA